MSAQESIDLAEMARRLLCSGAAHDGVRLGVDVVDVRAMARQLATSSGQRFLETRFTSAELADSRGRADRVAARWAAKEAVAKAIGTGFRGLRPSMIEVVKSPQGQPSVRAVGDVPWPNEAQKWRWALSLAHDGDVALAVAMAVNAPMPEMLQAVSTPPQRSCCTDPPSE
jgi:holo-[acyl-carrier protein] synthase